MSNSSKTEYGDVVKLSAVPTITLSPPMLLPLNENLWQIQHHFAVNGLPLETRMTVLRLADGGLWLHSPVPTSAADRAALENLGPVRWIVAPSKNHHLFVADCARHWPGAGVFAAPGLRQKRPDLTMMRELPDNDRAPWTGELEYLLFEGIPFANETVWWHRLSRTLIVTDLLQWWAGELSWSSRTYARLMGVRQRLGVAYTVRLLMRDQAAARRSAARILDWPVERVTVAHHAVVTTRAVDELRRALEEWLGFLPPGRSVLHQGEPARMDHDD